MGAAGTETVNMRQNKPVTSPITIFLDAIGVFLLLYSSPVVIKYPKWITGVSSRNDKERRVVNPSEILSIRKPVFAVSLSTILLHRLHYCLNQKPGLQCANAY